MGTIRVSNEVPSTPSTGNTEIYVDPADKKLKTKDDAGTVIDYTSSNGISALTGEVTAAGSGSVAATITNSAVIAKLLTGFVQGTGTISASDSILTAIQKLAARQNSGWFGEASDGDVIISSNTTLVRDMYYNTLVVNVGATIFTAGFRIFAKTSIEVNGTIDRSGNDAVGITAGAGLIAGTLSLCAAGGAGGIAAGTAGGASATALGNIGGNGGLGASGAGGAAGATTLVTAVAGGVELFQAASKAQIGYTTTNVLVTGGGAGGGGGGDGTAGGGGGGGGGVLVLSTRHLFGTGAIRCHGGNGGQPVGGNRGGGGGGGGGVACFITENDTTSTSLTVDVAGGLAGSATGTGVSGIAGSTGRIYRVRV